MKNLKKINQSDLKTLLRERLENKSNYNHRPLIVWRSNLEDGIQKRILTEVFDEYNKNKTVECREWYKVIHPGANSDEYINDPEIFLNVDFKDSRYGKYNVGLRVIDPLGMGNSWEEFMKIIQKNSMDNFQSSEIPFVAFITRIGNKYEQPQNYPNAEQYVFEPDFEEWLIWARKNGFAEFILDFIKGNGNQEDITSRWYNMFNNYNDENKTNRPGCSYPAIWESINKFFNKKIERKESDFRKFGDAIEEMTEFKILNGMSFDLKDDFIKYLNSQEIKKN